MSNKNGISMVEYAGQLLTENVGTDPDLLEHISERINVPVSVLKRMMNPPARFYPLLEHIERVLLYFGHTMVLIPEEE